MLAHLKDDSCYQIIQDCFKVLIIYNTKLAPDKFDTYNYLESIIRF